jgi:hypothetical protein
LRPAQGRSATRDPDYLGDHRNFCAGQEPVSLGNRFHRHSSLCVRNGGIERLVVQAWKHQPNTGDSPRNAAAWRARPRPSDTARFWRRWRRPGGGSPRRLIWKALTLRPDGSPLCACGVPFRSRDAATPAPFAIRQLATWDPGWRPRFPGTPPRNADTRLIAPFRKPALIYRNAAAGRMVPNCQSNSLIFSGRWGARGARCSNPPQWPSGGFFPDAASTKARGSTRLS